MGWVTPTDSGRFKAAFRTAEGTTRYKTFDYEFEAETFLAEAETRLADARVAATQTTGIPAPARAYYPPVTRGRRAPMLSELAADWLHRCKARELTASTLYGYDLEVRRLSKGPLASMRIDTIMKRHVETWLADLVEAGTGNATRRMHLKVLRMICNDAIDNRIITEDPTRKIRLPKPGKARKRPLDRAESARLLLAAKADPRAREFFLVALEAGLRWGEIAGLGYYAVELESRMIAIWQVVDKATGQLRSFPKDHEPRRVPMTAKLTDALRPLVAAAADNPHGLLFPTAAGAPLDYNNWARDFWYPARTAAKLADPQPRFHDLRHTYATRLARANVPIREIAQVLGHEDEAITSGYIHELDERARGKLIRAALAKYA